MKKLLDASTEVYRLSIDALVFVTAFPTRDMLQKIWHSNMNASKKGANPFTL